MKLEIISTGNEIMSGSIIDTNASYISKKLNDIGFSVERKTSVSDNLESLIKIFKEASKRSDVVIVTGGLGPTKDDLTTLAVSKLIKKNLVLNDVAIKTLENYFKKKNLDKKLFSANKKQAFLPDGVDTIENVLGTAVGFFIEYEKCILFFLPGVPYEMKKMLEFSVLPKLQKKHKPSGLKLFETISTFEVGESEVSKKLADIEKKFSDIEIGYRANFPCVYINIYSQNNKNIKKVKKKIIEIFGEKVFSTKNLSMAKEIFKTLLKKKKNIAIAESCTGGLIANMFTNISGSSNVFLFSAVTYSNETKMKVLGVKKDTIEKFGAVSIETAKEMARGVKKVANSDIGLSISGIAGPNGGTKEKPIGTVCIAIVSDRFEISKKFHLNFNDRIRNKIFFAFKALNLLRLKILNE